MIFYLLYLPAFELFFRIFQKRKHNDEICYSHGIESSTGGIIYGQGSNESLIDFVKDIKNRLPYSLHTEESEKYFGRTYGTDIRVLDIKEVDDLFVLIYELTEASDDELTIETISKTGKRLDKLIMTSDFVWKFDFIKPRTLKISVRYQEGISIWDTQYFEIVNGEIKVINWEKDWSGLAELNKDQLRVVRNRIFAKYGYTFKSADLRDFFSRFMWYEPTKSNVNNQLTEEDKKFVNYILELSKK